MLQDRITQGSAVGIDGGPKPMWTNGFSLLGCKSVSPARCKRQLQRTHPSASSFLTLQSTRVLIFDAPRLFGGSVTIKRRETGRGVRYDVQWRLPDRSKRKKTFRTEREARRFEAKLISSGALGDAVDPRGGKVPLQDVYRSWLASRPDLSPKVRRWV